MSPTRVYYQQPGHFVAATASLMILDIFVVGLRFWTRHREKLPRKLDDWLMVPALFLSVAGSIALIYAVAKKALAYPTAIPGDFEGSPLMLVTDQLTLTSEVEITYKTLVPLILGCTKTSFLFFYLRIFSISRLDRSVMYILIAITSVWTVGFFFANLFQCGVKFWVFVGTVVDILEQCVDTTALSMARAWSDVITDVIIIFAPIPLIWRLRLPTGKKLSASIVFLLGGVAISASLVRAVVITHVRLHGIPLDADQVLTVTLDLYWSMIECSAGILAACLPTLRGLAAVRYIQGPMWQSLASATRILISPHQSRTRVQDIEEDTLSDHIHDGSYVIGRQAIPRHTGSKDQLHTKHLQEPVRTYQMATFGKVKTNEAVQV